MSLGIASELGRSDDLQPTGKSAAYGRTFAGVDADGNLQYADSEAKGFTSIFDPVLTEIVYSWFSAPGARILDPFAGGSVRGIVAGKLGRHYFGADLRAEQCEANEQQIDLLEPDEPAPVWKACDSKNIGEAFPEGNMDLVFSCPPYHDLEQYSDDPDDISNMDYDEFLEAYRTIVAESCALLKDDRFACFVVGEIRDKKGNYRNFVGDTVEAFRAAGLEFYNEAILVTPIGSSFLRAPLIFKKRKMTKTHQNVLVFVKGDGKAAAEACGDVEIADPEAWGIVPEDDE